MPNAPEHGANAPKKRRRLRRALRLCLLAAVFGIAFLLLFLLLLPWITNAGPVRGLVARLVAGRLRGADVRLDTLRVAPLRREVFSMGGLRIAPEGRPGDTILTLGRLAVRWSPADLLHRRLHLTSVAVDSVRLDARREADGWNVVDLMPKPGKPLTLDVLNLPLGVQVDSLQVRDVELTATAGPALKAAVHGLSAEMSCGLSGFIQGALTRRRPRRPPGRRHAARLAAPGEGLRRERLRAQLLEDAAPVRHADAAAGGRAGGRLRRHAAAALRRRVRGRRRPGRPRAAACGSRLPGARPGRRRADVLPARRPRVQAERPQQRRRRPRHAAARPAAPRRRARRVARCRRPRARRHGP